jgi:tRNA nucleotidyltransferase (CCA-adding enzyme)
MEKELNIIFLMDGADLDAFSSSFGLSLLDKNAKILLPNGLSKTTLMTIKNFEDLLEDKLIKIKDLEGKKIKKVYLTDSSDIEEIFEKIGNYLDEDYSIEVIDHHLNKELKQDERVKYRIEKVGSATTIVVEEIEKKNIDITPDEATILALGIYEDTGSFKYDLTTPRDLKATAFLLEKGANLEFIREILEKGITEEQLEVISQLTKNIQYLNINNKKIIISTALTQKYIPDISSKIGLIRPFQDADAFFLLISVKGKISIIARSRDKEIDVGEILSHLGGGGHKSAASGKIKGLPLNEVKEYLESIITNYLQNDKKKIKDIVYTDIKIFSPDTKLKEVKEFLKENIAEVILVGDKNRRFKGIIPIKVIEKALEWERENITLRDLVIEDIITFSPEMSILEAERYLIKTSQDYFPVIKNGKILGIVSRGYLLKTIHGQLFSSSDMDIFISRERIKPRIIDFTSKLESHFSNDILEELKLFGKVAKEIGYRAFLVGGIVRDIVMKNKKSLDIDILVEGDALKLLEKLKKDYGYSTQFHNQFFSGSLTLKSKGIKIDFATARKEEYEHPGAYPKVKKATLKEDLYRRDFTINTLAVEITSDNYGKLIDFFNGLKDINDKVIRILQPLSFVEDPIRILRAVRFAGRFNFKLGKPTERLLKMAINEEVLKIAPRARIKQELEYIFQEKNVLEIINLMNKYKILHQLIPNFVMSRKRLEILSRLKTLINTYEILFKGEADKVGLYLLALLYHLPYEIAYKILEKYQLLEKKDLFEGFYNIKDEFKKIPKKDSEIYKKIKNLDKNIIIFLAAYIDRDLTKRIMDIFNKEKNFKSILSGRDLIKLGLKPSPQMGKILNDVLYKHLDNEIKTKEEALKYVKEKYLEKVNV